MIDSTARLDMSRVLITVEEAAERLGLGRTTVFALIKSGEIVSVRIGRARRIPPAVLTAYVDCLVADQVAG